MLIQLNTTQWLALPMEVRMKLKDLFGIPRSTGTVLQDNTVLSDGHTHADLSRISVEAMQEFVGKKEKDFYKLFDLTLIKLAQKPPEAAVADEVKPQVTQELLIEHNGKTYKLVEVTPTTKVDGAAPLYPQGPKAPESPAPKAKRVRGPNKPKTKAK